MYDIIRNWSTEEKLLVQGVITKYNSSVMSIGLVNFWWNIRGLSPEHENVKAIKDWVSTLMDFQVKIGVDLAKAGIPKDSMLNAPISKSIFQTLSQDKKNVFQDLFFEKLGNKLGELKPFATGVMMDIWNNELIR